MRNKQENLAIQKLVRQQFWIGLLGKVWPLGKFQDNMYLAKTNDEKVFALKPMNCPGGIQIYNNSLRSYRDLPLRIAEFGKVFRFEPSGALHGLMRVREFTQDDAHIYCLKEQMEEECEKVII